MCGLMSDPVAWKFRKSMVIHDSECPYWEPVSLNNTDNPNPFGFTKCHQTVQEYGDNNIA